MAQQLDEWLRCCTVKITFPGQGGWGTGFFVAPGLILTCAHVVKAAPANSVTVFYSEQNQSYSAIVEALPAANEQVDLALLKLQDAIPAQPCVYLDAAIALNDQLYSYGYPDDFSEGAFTTFESEALTGGNSFIKFKSGQVRPGMSGSPLLNQSTGKVCGIVKFTRNRSIDLGGGAIPTRVILEQFPQLRELQQQFHQGDQRWSDLVAELPEAEAMNQTNFGGRNYQTQTGANNTNYIGETYIYNYSSPSPDAGLSARTIDFQPYLRSIIDNEDYREWQEVYMPTTVEDRKRSYDVNLTESPQPKFSRRLKLRVETVKSSESQENQRTESTGRQEVEQLDVLAGLRKYAPDHVLLIGRPGSGKSTSLERLLWEEADNALKQAANAKIPVLVKLRRCTGTIEALIQDFFRGHQLSLAIAEIETLLDQGRLLLLLDGLNELPEAFRTDLANFRDRYRATTPMIVSTRELSIGGNLGIAKTLKMLPLTESQMQEFVQGYLGQEGNRLFQQLKGDRLQKFAETPLLLWMLCRVFAQNGRVPANLGLAFREFAQLYDEDIQQDAPADSREQWSKLLRHLAFSLMHDREPTDFRLSMQKEEAADRLTKWLQQEGRANPREYAERWLKDLLSYHLIQLVIQPNFEEHIEFRHQLIQEYYAAEYLLRILSTLSDEQLKRDYLNYLKWTEPVALMLAMVEEEAQALRVVKLAMDEVDLMLGARLAGDVKQEFQGKTIGLVKELQMPLQLKTGLLGVTGSEAAIPELLHALEHQCIDVCKIAVYSLSNLKSREALQGVLQALDHQSAEVRESAVDSLWLDYEEASIPGLLKGLADQDAGVRISAASSLVHVSYIHTSCMHDCEEAISGLLNALTDQEADVRGKAIDALAALKSEEAIPGLLNALTDQKADVRGKATCALLRLESEEAIPGLLSALEHQNADVRLSAACVLSELKSEKAIPSLLSALEHQNVGVRASAIFVLSKLKNEEALLTAFEHQDIDVRVSMAYMLFELKDEETTPGLLSFLEHHNIDVRSIAACRLFGPKDEEAVPRLLSALKHQNIDVRWTAAYTLGTLKSKKAIPGLLNALADQDDRVRGMAACSLIKLNYEEAIPGLLNALADQDDRVRGMAACILIELNCKEAIPGLLSALESQNLYFCWSAAFVLININHKEVVPGLLDALQHQKVYIRWLAAYVLANLDCEEALPSLLNMLAEQGCHTREEADKVINNLKIPGLRQMLKNQDSNVSENADEVLDHLNRKEAIPESIQTVTNQDSNVSENADEVLDHLNREETVPELIQMLKNEDSDIRRNAAFKLGEIGHPQLLSLLWRILLSTISTTDGEAYSAISDIQDRCKYYNHEIAHNLPPPGKSIALYFSAAPSDADLQTHLANHLNLLERQAIITSWHHRQMLPGDDRAQVINDRLNTADIILLLISADSLADHTCYDVEINRATERHQVGDARVIPILLRPVDWTGAPFNQFLVLPKNHQPITTWRDRDAAFQEIAEGIRDVAIELRRMNGEE